MRRSIGLVLVGLGVLMLVLAPLSRWYAYPRLAVVSNDVAERVSAGNAVTVLDLGAVVRQDAEIERVTDVRSVRRIIPDQGDSTGDTAVWDTSVTTFDEAGAGATPEENVLSYYEERVAFDRHGADSVDGHDQYYTPTGESADRVDVDHEGYYFKLPFGTEQRSYPFWDSTIQDTRPMEFQNETTLEGLPVYVFEQVVEPTPVSALEVPGALFGQAGSIVADRVYSNTRTIWVEPRTGAIIKGEEEQDSYLDFEGTRGPTIVQGTIAYTDAQVTANVDEYSSSADRLGLVRDTVPVAAAAGGLVLVVTGLLLARRGSYHGKRRSPGADDGPDGVGGSSDPSGSAGVVTRPAGERTALQQRPRVQEPTRSLFERPRYEPPQLSAYDATPHQAAAEPMPPEETPATYAEEPRLHFETAPGAGTAVAADRSAHSIHDDPQYADPQYAAPVDDAGQFVHADQDSRQAPEQSSLPRRRPQSGSVRPPVGRAQAQGQSAQSLLGQSPTGPLTPAQPHDDHAEPAVPADAGTTAGRAAPADAGSAELERARADLVRLEQARAELARFAQEHPDLAASGGAAEPAGSGPVPAEADAVAEAATGADAEAANDAATQPSAGHPAAAADLVQPAAATPEPTPATPAQGRRRARDDDALFDEFDEDGRSAGSMHRY
ncbi:DUF3068 domain-containing protein [Jiangella muralis]|uniref:DUF3068 domain-containing protein n=1 Tax=Jiangella muralis TaxID=702383 RepID=UPI00069CEDBB|nr:DUF3068 domain-containing protein [Jiangella muralis]